MQIENFKIFADLVETKSFSKAAKLNGITQSAVSQQARAMERHFKALLVDRSQKQFQLTREGQRVYESAKDVLHAYEMLLSELQEMKKVVSGTIRISTIYSIGLHELPPYIKRFLHDFPSVNVRVEYRRSNLVYEDILHNCGRLRARRLSREGAPDRRNDPVPRRPPDRHLPSAARAREARRGVGRRPRRPEVHRVRPRHSDPQGRRPDPPRQQAGDRAGDGVRQHRDREARGGDRPRDRDRARRRPSSRRRSRARSPSCRFKGGTSPARSRSCTARAASSRRR
jgi:DNA-binding transcriptional LysR family regulator